MSLTEVLMLDLGNTLVRDGVVLPHVPEALRALKGFETASGKLLELTLVSDYLPADPPTREKAADKFSEYIRLLENFGLRPFFEPVERHVTLSTQAGAKKPQRRLFELALERLGTKGALDRCLFITEAADHVAAARQLGISALQFGASGNGEPKFENWADGLLLIAQFVGPERSANMWTAVRTWLNARLDMELVALDTPVAGQPLRIVANQLYPIPDVDLVQSDRLYVRMPAQIELALDGRGGIKDFTVHAPSREDQDEAAYFVRNLIQHQQLAPSAEAIQPSVTHVIERDRHGRRVVTRRGYSAY